MDPLVQVGIALIFAFIFGEIASRLKQNTALGYIIAGIILGPLALNYLVPGLGIAPIFGNIGLVMILFYLGLEMNLKRIRQAGAIPFVMAATHLTVAFLLGFTIASIFGFSPLAAAVAGALITASSTVMVARFIFDRKILDEPSSRIALAILVLEDFFGIFVLVFISSLSAQKSINLYVLNGLLFVIAMFFIVSKVSRYILNFLHGLGHQDKMVFYAIAVGLLSSYIGGQLGLSTSLGAYFAGFALAESAYGDKIKNQLGLFREFFLLFFFVSFGTTLFFNEQTMQVIKPTLNVLLPIAGLAIALSITYVVASTIAFFIAGGLLGIDIDTVSSVTALMVPLGEFVVIISNASKPLLSQAVWTTLVTAGFLIIILTAPLGPLLYDRRKSMSELYLSLFPKSLQVFFANTGKQIGSASKILDNPIFEDQYLQSVERMLKYLIIAFSIVYIGTLLLSSLSSTTTPLVLSIPNEVAIGFILLLLVTWPLFNFVSELRFLVEVLSRNIIRSSFPSLSKGTEIIEDEVAEAFTGLLLTTIGIASTVAIYYAFIDNPLFTIIPLAYTMLALMHFSRAFYALIDHFEPLGDLSTEEEGIIIDSDPKLIKLRNEFEERSRRFSILHAERELLKDQIRQAIRKKDIVQIRNLLSKFKLKEEKLMIRLAPLDESKYNLRSSVNPSQNSRKSMEYYLLKRAIDFDKDLKQKKKKIN